MLFRPALGAVPALVLCALFGLSPFFVEFRDEIRPDTLFLALFLLTLWLGDRWTGTGHGWNWRAARRGILLGAVAYLAYGTRSLGLVLIPALWLVELARLRRLTPILLIATSMFGVLLVAQTALLHSDASYSGGMTVAPSTLRYNALHYATSLSILWSNFWPAPWGFALRTTLFAATLVLAAVGWAQRLRRGISVLEVVPWLYFAPLVFYRVGTMIQQRYLLPLLPLYLFYAWLGFGTLRKLPYPRLVIGATAVLAGALITAYLGGHVGVARGTITPGITAPDTEKIFTWLREHTASNAVVLVGRARAFALYTQRRAVSPYGYRTTADFWQLIASHGVTHLVVGRGPLAVEMDYEHPDELAALVAIYPQQLPLVVDNSSFAVYQVAARPDPATAP